MWQELSDERHPDMRLTHLHQLLAAVKLQLSTDGIGSDQEDKQHQDSWYHNGSQVCIIVCRRIANLMQINGNGLHQRLDLLVSESLSTHRCHTQCRRT